MVLPQYVAPALLFRHGHGVSEVENVTLVAFAVLFSIGCSDQAGPADERDASRADVVSEQAVVFAFALDRTVRLGTYVLYGRSGLCIDETDHVAQRRYGVRNERRGRGLRLSQPPHDREPVPADGARLRSLREQVRDAVHAGSPPGTKCIDRQFFDRPLMQLDAITSSMRNPDASVALNTPAFHAPTPPPYLNCPRDGYKRDRLVSLRRRGRRES